MPGSIQISAIQPSVTPLFLQVAVGKREYSENIGQDSLSFPVTSLRESMVIMLYNADRELISKTELQTKTIVESGTTDVVCTLDSGGEVTLQLQFLLSDDDRKRIQEMRSSAMKRKQQELPGDGYELNFPDSPLSKRLIEKISNIESKREQTITKLQTSLSLDDKQDRAISSGIDVDPCLKASRDLLLQTGSRKFEDPDGSKEGLGKPESRSNSAVKKMISAFESTSSQGILSSETSASVNLSSGCKETDKEIGDNKGSNCGSRKQISFVQKPDQNGVPTASYESRSRDGASKQKVREDDLSRSKRRSQEKHRRSIGPFPLEQLHSMGSSRSYLEYPLTNLVGTSSKWLHPHVCVTTASRELKDLLELEHLRSLTHIGHADKSEIRESTCDNEQVASAGGIGGFPVLNLNGWLINQGVRVAIVVIACGAVFLNNR
ncbi:hypothetical protein QOZ80_5AG0360950 [Eleusine coracana subsp. coracana]|nr:hypothetical protein QOZ80_5AG0360950 [Eleusine coracana subsp. coracana]